MSHQVSVLKDGYVRSTDSPDGNFFYRIRRVFELRMAMFAADVAFFKNDGTLLYCTHPNRPSSFIPPFKRVDFVKWIGASTPFFVEYDGGDLTYCVLDFAEGIKYTCRVGQHYEVDVFGASATADFLDEVRRLWAQEPIAGLHHEVKRRYRSIRFFHRWRP